MTVSRSATLIQIDSAQISCMSADLSMCTSATSSSEVMYSSRWCVCVSVISAQCEKTLCPCLCPLAQLCFDGVHQVAPPWWIFHLSEREREREREREHILVSCETEAGRQCDVDVDNVHIHSTSVARLRRCGILSWWVAEHLGVYFCHFVLMRCDYDDDYDDVDVVVCQWTNEWMSVAGWWYVRKWLVVLSLRRMNGLKWQAAVMSRMLSEWYMYAVV